MPRPSLSPAQRLAKVGDDLDLATYAIQSIKRAISAGDEAAMHEAAKVLEAVGCYARRTSLPTPDPAPATGAIPAGQKVKVYGPNLADQSKGDFHVHAEGCSKKPRLLFGGTDDNPWVIDATTKYGITAEVYADMIFSNDCDPVESYLTSLHFCPCVKLPLGNPDDHRAE